jgi:TPR repeat protein
MPRVRAALLALALSATACEPPAPDGAAPAAALSAPAASPVAVAAEVVPPAEPTGATEAPTAGCGTADACHEAAVKQEREHHASRAIALYASACDLGSGRSCHRAGELIRDGRGVEVDEHRARQLFERGCERGSPAACDALGH